MQAFLRSSFLLEHTQSAGSGCVIDLRDAKGRPLVEGNTAAWVTAHHVVSSFNGHGSLIVRVPKRVNKNTGKLEFIRAEAEVVGTCPHADVAVVKPDIDIGRDPMPLAWNVEFGEFGGTIGYPWRDARPMDPGYILSAADDMILMNDVVDSGASGGALGVMRRRGSGKTSKEAVHYAGMGMQWEQSGNDSGRLYSHFQPSWIVAPFVQRILQGEQTIEGAHLGFGAKPALDREIFALSKSDALPMLAHITGAFTFGPAAMLEPGDIVRTIRADELKWIRGKGQPRHPGAIETIAAFDLLARPGSRPILEIARPTKSGYSSIEIKLDALPTKRVFNTQWLSSAGLEAVETVVPIQDNGTRKLYRGVKATRISAELRTNLGLVDGDVILGTCSRKDESVTQQQSIADCETTGTPTISELTSLVKDQPVLDGLAIARKGKAAVVVPTDKKWLHDKIWSFFVSNGS